MTRPRIGRNCVGQYLIVGLRLNPSLRRELEAEGWRWARGLRRGGSYFTEDQALAEQTAARLGLEIRPSATEKSSPGTAAAGLAEMVL